VNLPHFRNHLAPLSQEFLNNYKLQIARITFAFVRVKLDQDNQTSTHRFPSGAPLMKVDCAMKKFSIANVAFPTYACMWTIENDGKFINC
jgi:hypothetical protein